MGNQMPRTDTCSKPQVVEPSTPGKCSSVENDSVKNVCLSSGLSSKGEILILSFLFTSQCCFPQILHILKTALFLGIYVHGQQKGSSVYDSAKKKNKKKSFFCRE